MKVASPHSAGLAVDVNYSSLGDIAGGLTGGNNDKKKMASITLLPAKKNSLPEEKPETEKALSEKEEELLKL